MTEILLLAKQSSKRRVKQVSLGKRARRYHLFVPPFVLGFGCVRLHNLNPTAMTYQSLARDSPSFRSDALLHRPDARQHARSLANLGVDPVEMKFHRFFADAYCRGNPFVGSASENQLNDLSFALREIG